jgi:nicotinamidase-related amidase
MILSFGQRKFRQMMQMKQKMSQLLVVDLQDKVLDPIQDKHEIIETTSRLITAAKALDIPITVSEHYRKGLGHTVKPLRAVLGTDVPVFEKLHFSCVKDEALRHRFEDNRDVGRGQVVIAGIETHVCVGQTSLDLIVEGFEVFLVGDATGSRSPLSRDLAFARLRQAGAFIVHSEMVLFEWLEKAGTPDFKALLPLLK